MLRYYIVSNRLPVKAVKRGDRLILQPSVGGLTTGMACLPEDLKKFWLGWPGMPVDDLSDEEQANITEELSRKNYYPIFLSQDQIENHYCGFCNKTIWPLFHYFPLYTVYEDKYWQAYKEVNEIFCKKLSSLAGTGDRIWIQDYQLLLLPGMVREKIPEAEIGFFLHIPFPSYELFRLLPWRTEILKGILGADLIGFHTYDYVRHFLSSVCRLTSGEHTLGELIIEDRLVKVDAFPMGIDYEKYAHASKSVRVQREINKFRKQMGDSKVIISIDRLDYTKGIIQRLEAYDLFLTENLQYHGKVTMILLAVPSRTGVDDYMDLRRQIERLVGMINGKHSSIGWVPIHYLYRELPFERLVALYEISDIALVTPLRDGMNLVAKEYVAVKRGQTGVLILGEMTGAASELGESLIINSNDRRDIAAGIKEALEMPPEEQVRRNRLMQNRLMRYNVTRWVHDFFHELDNIIKKRRKFTVQKLSATLREELLHDYYAASKRLILLDYDGTLINFVSDPVKAEPDSATCEILRDLSRISENEVVVISGRDKDTLTSWLGSCSVNLVAEYGAWIKKQDSEWQMMEPLDNNWKENIRPILELYVDRTPGSFIEEKDFALVWHYRRAERELAHVRTQEIREAVWDFTANIDIGAFEGNKVLEIKKIAVNKGHATEFWLSRGPWDFVMAIGDDYMDEDMFCALPENAYTIKVGTGMSNAHFFLESVDQVRSLLNDLKGKYSVKT